MSSIVSNIKQVDSSVNVLQALLWEYSNAPNINSLLNSKAAWYNENQQGFWDDWYNDVFNLATANDFGLAVWSIILGQSLYNNYSGDLTTPFVGFGSGNQNFGVYNFGSVGGGNTIYTTETARLLLQLRYFKLVSSGTVPETNRMLKYLFSSYGEAYLVDNHNMTQTYYFLFVIPAEIAYMLDNTDVLPRPAGVQSSIVGF